MNKTLIGCLIMLAWLLALATYTFGQEIDPLDDIEIEEELIEQTPQPPPPPPPQPAKKCIVLPIGGTLYKFCL